ncbi:Aspartic peptidase A1 family protein [Dioscorea alata]|uniref:Aspartic peptidase A1 family protein n=1 Tax=Dioscorea alata TaxID=55571 RepID=A0ACB7VJU2_DIOAL|nr:Aspartic peptidase A1 family protein [Dioscorea alata]
MKQIKSQVILLLLIIFITKSLSLHLNMIHRDSIHSPTYPGNLTAHDRLLRISHQAKARADYIEATLSYPPSNSSTILSINAWSPIRATSDDFLYITDLTFGTPPPPKPLTTYHLILDTGSRLTWLQSQPCKQCWPQDAPYFDPAKDSTTWKPLPCSHPFCELRLRGWSCENNQCIYLVKYGDGAKTSGVLATDRLGFSSNQGGPEFVNNLVFGCGHENLGFDPPKNFNGLVGLNSKPASLASQMGQRFSYCLSPFISDTQPPNKLRFGDDAIIHDPNVKTISFVKVPNVGHYYLPLIDISIASKRLGFAPGTFVPKKVGKKYEGGFISDSGSSMMMFMKNGPYETIIDGFVNYFKPYKLKRVRQKDFDVCYMRKEGFSSYPTMTFHFENGNDLLVEGENVVFMHPESDYFCVTIAGTEKTNLFGAAQQADYKFSYDLAKGELSYVSADCSKDG